MHVASCCAHQERPAMPLCLQPFTDNQSRRGQIVLPYRKEHLGKIFTLDVLPFRSLKVDLRLSDFY